MSWDQISWQTIWGGGYSVSSQAAGTSYIAVFSFDPESDGGELYKGLFHILIPSHPQNKLSEKGIFVSDFLCVWREKYLTDDAQCVLERPMSRAKLPTLLHFLNGVGSILLCSSTPGYLQWIWGALGCARGFTVPKGKLWFAMTTLIACIKVGELHPLANGWSEVD